MTITMKKIKLYITAIGLLICGSCGESFLDSKPYTQLTDVNFYRNPSEAYQALVGVYDGLQRMYSSGFGIVTTSEVLSDNAFGGGGKADGYGGQLLDEFDPLRSPVDRDILQDVWKDYYRGIYRCNVLLTKLDGVAWGDSEELKDQYAAETRFIRAVAYFDLVRLFGNVVLLTEPSIENLPQAHPDDVFKVIAEDLQFAVAHLPAVSYSAQAASDHGRVTKWAAEALLARVYLFYTGRYQKSDLAGVVTKQQALDGLEDLIAQSGHDLVDDFTTLWPAASVAAEVEYAGERNPENIFNIKYTYTSDWNGNVDGNHWLVMFGVRGGNYLPFGQGWGFGTVNPKLVSAYSDTDTRKAATIITVESELNGFNNSDQREFTGYYNKKYTPMSVEDLDDNGNPVVKSLAEKMGGVSFMISQFQDYVMIRYADVLLMAAELGSPNAQAYFDKVRERAYKENFSSIPVNMTNIMNERRLEFAYEGIRFFDLLRQGVDVAATTIGETTTVLNGGVSTTKTISSSKITLTEGLQQIPNSQITLSDNVLKQNEGWKYET
jgi:starch-binding outer membrane protein, SusD/RagB family